MQEDALNPYEFLTEGGEAGEMIRSIDWSTTALGIPSGWSQSFRTALNILLQSSYPMYLAWGDNYTQFFNDEYSRISGLPIQPQSIGKSAKETFAGTWNEIESLFNKIRGGKYIRTQDTLLLSGLTAFSDEKHFLFSYGPVYEQGGNVGGIFVTVNEVLTGQIEDLRQSEEQYHGMTSEVEDYAILLLDTSGNIRNWNKGAEKIKGYKAEEIIGKNFRLFYPEKDQKEKLPERLLHEAAINGRATHEGWRVRKDRTKFWGSTVITAYHNRKNEIIGFSKVTRDLTERKLAEEVLRSNAEQLERKNRELERSNNELMSFSYIASHDLQEPLRKIQAFSNLILDHDGASISESSKDYFNRMIKASYRMQNLIDSLLEFSRTTTTQKKFEVTDLNGLVSEVKTELREQIEQTKAVVTSDDLPLLTVIPFQFKQLLYNLIANAIKYARQGVPPVIRISHRFLSSGTFHSSNARPGTDYLEISVADNGIGFEQEYATKVFELFQRLHARHEYTGSGIGLAICKKIAENHEGFMTVDSEPGVGSVFHLYLPVSEDKRGKAVAS